MSSKAKGNESTDPYAPPTQAVETLGVCPRIPFYSAEFA